MANPAAIVRRFLEAFFRGEIETARAMIGEEFTFRAALMDGTARADAYFAGAERKARSIRSFRILRQWEDGNDVSTLYELEISTPEGTATMPIHEWHAVRDGKIASTMMVFNGGAKAVSLLRNALLP